MVDSLITGLLEKGDIVTIECFGDWEPLGFITEVGEGCCGCQHCTGCRKYLVQYVIDPQFLDYDYERREAQRNMDPPWDPNDRGITNPAWFHHTSLDLVDWLTPEEINLKKKLI